MAEQDGFEALYRAYRPLVCRLAERLVGPDEAEDLVQEVMLRACRQHATAGFTRPPGPWLATVTRNLAIDVYRRSGRSCPATTSELDELAEPSGDAPLSAALRWDVRQRLAQALRRLPPSDRALLVRHEIDGATIVSMAGALGISANALRQRLFRVRRSLVHHYLRLGGEYAALAVEGSRDAALPGARYPACGPRSVPRSTPYSSGGMLREITQRELCNDSGEIMRRLDQGETFVVTRNGVPVGELVPLRRHRFVDAGAAVAMFANAPGIDVERFRADLDTVASQDVAPRA